METRINYIHPVTGEVKELGTDTQAKEAHLELKKVERLLKEAKQKVNDKLLEELERNNGKPLEYEDGTVISLVTGAAATRSIKREDWVNFVGDQDKADLALKVDVAKAEKLIKDWVKEGETVGKLDTIVKKTYKKDYPMVTK